MSYLIGVKESLEDVFLEAFEKAWKDVVEPALKESYKNGVAEGRKSAGVADPKPEAKAQRRRWSRPARSAPEHEEA